MFFFVFKTVYTCFPIFVVDGDSLTGGVHISGRDVDCGNDDVVLMLPSSQLAELDQAYKSGGQDEARQLLQNQSMEQVYQHVLSLLVSCTVQFQPFNVSYLLIR